MILLGKEHGTYWKRRWCKSTSFDFCLALRHMWTVNLVHGWFTDWGTWLACWFLESVFPIWCAFCMLAFYPLTLCFLVSFPTLLFFPLLFSLSFFFTFSSVMTCHDLPGLGFVFTFREECTSRALVSHSFTGGSGVILSSFGSGCEFGRSMRVLVQQLGFYLGYEKVD